MDHGCMDARNLNEIREEKKKPTPTNPHRFIGWLPNRALSIYGTEGLLVTCDVLHYQRSSHGILLPVLLSHLCFLLAQPFLEIIGLTDMRRSKQFSSESSLSSVRVRSRTEIYRYYCCAAISSPLPGRRHLHLSGFSCTPSGCTGHGKDALSLNLHLPIRQKDRHLSSRQSR